MLGVLTGDALAVVGRLRARPPVLVTYEHRFRTACLDRDCAEAVTEDSSWRVMHCLGLDPEGKIAEAVETMLGGEVKAVPLGGAAARIAPLPDGEVHQPVRGKVYCSLPLPLETGLPVHLNGFFDLDSSRHALTTESGLTGAAKVRARWNQLLVQHVVAPAYAHLIDHLAADLGDDAAVYYAHWPRPELALPKPLDALVKVAYQKLAPLDVIRVHGVEGWRPIGKVLLIPAHWDDLEEPLAADGLPLPEPRLATAVVTGFQGAGVATQKVTPQLVRDRLKQVKRLASPGVPVDQAPRECLRKRSWLETLLRFCLTDRPKDLTDLPLALMADGRLRSFVADPKYPIYAAGAEERNLFPGQPHWFLDQAYAEACGITGPPVPGGMYWMTPGEVTRCLPSLLPEHEEIRLNPEGAGARFPSSNWLTALYRYLLKAVRGGHKWAQEDFRKIPLVPDQTNVLRCPGLLGTPLLGQQEAEELSGALQVLKVPLVSGPPELREVIAAFAIAFDGFVWPLTGPDLVDTLADLDADDLPEYRPDVHPPLLNYLAQRRWTADAYRARPERLPALRGLAIFPTADGRVADLEGDVFVSGGFPPPGFVRSVTLLQTGPADAWHPLLELCGVTQLSRATFIEDHLLPGYDGLEPDDKLTALGWLRDHLDQARSEFEDAEDGAQGLMEAVRTAPLVRCEDGEFRPATAVYDPGSELIRDLFGDSVHYPDRGYFARGWERWSDFFRGLGLVRTPRAKDLLDHLDRLIDRASSGLDGGLTASVLRVFDHIEEHWADLSRQPIGGEHGENLASALRERAWLPAETSSRGLRRWPGAVAPANRLYRPTELYLPAQANLVASQCAIFARARVKAEVQRALGFSTAVPLDIALLHFDRLLALWVSGGRPSRESFEAALHDVYGYLAGFAKGPEAAVIRTRCAGKACLWYRGRLWLPEHAFRAKVPFFGGRRVTIHVKEAAVRPAYGLLGMRETPRFDDYLAFLEELVEVFGENPLPADEIDRLLEVYRRLGEEARSVGSADRPFPLLTENGVLVNPQEAFYADAPWFQDRIRDPRVRFLHRGLPVTVTRLVWVRSLANEVRERPTGDRTPVGAPDALRRTAALESLVRSPEFRRGVDRLVYHEHGVRRSAISGWLARTRVVALNDLTSELVLSLDGQDVVVGSGPANQYFDAAHNQIYLDGNAGKLTRSFLAEAVNTGLEEHRLQNLSPLELILDCEPREIDQTLTRRRIRPIDDEAAFAAPETDERIDMPVDEADAADEDGTGPAADPGELPGEETAPEFDHAGVDETGDERPDAPRLSGAGARGRNEGTGRAGASSGSDRSQADGRGNRRPAPDPEADATGGRPPVSSPAGTHMRGSGPSRPMPPTSPRTGPGPDPTTRHEATGEPERQGRIPPDVHDRAPGTEAARPAAHGRADPEVRMRRGRRRRPGRERRRDRIVTYVAFGPGAEPTDPATALSETERQERIALGDAAADLVCAFERGHGRTPVKLPQAHPGWDIDSFDLRRVESGAGAGSPTRMIEVKGVRGPWGRQGVAISRRQFEAAREFGDRYWLYVVEFADDPARARIHPIHNPYARINQFWFDGGWRQLADPAEAPSAACRLAPGQRITVDNLGTGSVERVEERGALRVVHLRLDDGTLVRRPFNPATMRPAGG